MDSTLSRIWYFLIFRWKYAWSSRSRNRPASCKNRLYTKYITVKLSWNVVDIFWIYEITKLRSRNSLLAVKGELQIVLLGFFAGILDSPLKFMVTLPYNKFSYWMSIFYIRQLSKIIILSVLRQCSPSEGKGIRPVKISHLQSPSVLAF